MAASQSSVLQSQRTLSTSTQASSASSNERSTLSGTRPTSIETSPVLSSLTPTPPANTRPSPAANRRRKGAVKVTKTGKVTTALTLEQKLDRHKRKEAVRRNTIGSNLDIAMTWVPAEYRLPGKKWDAKTERVTAAANWLQDIKAGNDKLENHYNALLEAHGIISEAYLTAQTQLQEQQQHQHQHRSQQPTPPWDPLRQSQPAFDAASSFNPSLHWDNPSQRTIFQPLQQATPSPPQPPQPNQGYGFPWSEAKAVAESMFETGVQGLYRQH